MLFLGSDVPSGADLVAGQMIVLALLEYCLDAWEIAGDTEYVELVDFLGH